ncbi:MAG TPA: hypothetical protein VNA66_11300 [Gammaproteobacteria bacterium]|jgi:hypothetical protein|nr:hypothetical protein [Gammaproteobacteria bacterium]
MRTFVLCAFVLGTAAASAEAQWERVRDSSLQWSRDGRPNLFAPAPRVNGTPDLSGVWQPDGEPLPAGIEAVEGDLHFPRHMINIGADLEGGQPPMQPGAAKLFETRLGQEGPGAYCKPSGIPQLNAVVLPYKIVQAPKLVLVLYEENQVFRQIFLDGRKPVEGAVPRWMGYSTGHWDGDQLVVETTGVTDQSWLDGMGHPHTDRMHITERFRRRDVGHLEIQVTIDDPGSYTSPFTYTVKATLVPEDDLLEYFCTENEKDSEHYR